MANRFYVEPASPLAGFQMLAEGIGTRVEFERKKAEETQRQAKRQEAGQLMETGTPEEISQFMIENPWIQKDIDVAMDWRNEATKQNAIDSAKKVLLEGASPSQTLIDRAEFVIGQGGDATGSMALAEQAQLDPQVAISEAEKVLALYDPDALREYQSLQRGEVEEIPKVGAQEILEDGSIIQSTAKGPVVYNPLGEKVTGRAAADVIKQARAEKVSNVRKAAGEKKRASLEAEDELKGKVEAGVISQKEAAKISVKAFDRLEKIYTNIANLKEGAATLEEGVNTGPIMSRLPSLRTNAVKLDNLQGRLGLDILHSTTFGALSASELRFALSTALPQGLNALELKEWILEKIRVQEKLADYVEASAIYLGTPGNTVAGWMEKKRAERGRPAEAVADERLATELTDEELEAAAKSAGISFSGGL